MEAFDFADASMCVKGLWGGVFEESVELAGDVALEAASGFSCGFAFADSLGDVGLGEGAVSAAGDGDGVQCPVQVAVAAAVEAVASSLP